MLITAAKELGCSVFELMDQPYCWVEWALTYRDVVAEMEAEHQDD